MFTRLKQRFCKHIFNLNVMGCRNSEGLLRWDCMKCNKVFYFEYGLQAMDNGKIIQKEIYE